MTGPEQVTTPALASGLTPGPSPGVTPTGAKPSSTSPGSSGRTTPSVNSTMMGHQVTPDTLSRSPVSLIGHMVGEYRVTHFLGKGGMGWVFAAVHPIIGKKVAIKVLKTTFSHEEEVASAFINEAKAANAIGSRKIVDIFAFGQLPAGNLYFVMELLEGESMAAYLAREGRLSLADARIIFPWMLEALQAAHEHGIIHRDLKPENIFLIMKKGMVQDLRLLDFGIAKFNADQPQFLRTQAGIIKGTPLYMSPEQCRAEDTTAASDLYSLGIIMYQSFSGRVPFKSNSYGELIAAHLTEDPQPPAMHAPMPAELEALILACLNKDPLDRPESAREVSRQLEAILDAELSAPSRMEARARRRFRVTVGILLFLVVAAAVGGFVWFRVLNQEVQVLPPPPPPPRLLRVVSAHPSGVNREIAQGFSAWLEHVGHTPVHIEWVSQKDDLGAIQAEVRGAILEKRSSRLDVMIGGGESLHRTLARKDCVTAGEVRSPCSRVMLEPDSLVPHVPRKLGGTQLYDEEGYWYGVTLSGFGFACDHRVLEKLNVPFPRSWEDLASPALFQRLIAADPQYSSSTHMVLEMILQSLPWNDAWRVLVGLGANMRTWIKSSQGVLHQLADDPEIACGILIDYFFFLEKDSLEKTTGARLEFFIPPSTAWLTPDPVSVLARTGDEEASSQFLRYLFTEGQELWMRPAGARWGPVEQSVLRLSVDPRLYGPEKETVFHMNPFRAEQLRPFDSETAARRRQALGSLLQAALVLNHPNLVRAWQFRLEKGLLSANMKLTVPLSPEQFGKVLGEVQADALELRKLENRWIQDFTNLYRQLARP